MGRRLLLALIVTLAACGGTEPNVVAGDAVVDGPAVGAQADIDDSQTSAVADHSAPMAVSPSTTAPWEVTLKEYPLLQTLDETESDAQIGSARFILVDDAGEPVASGSSKYPEFYVQLDAWHGVRRYIEFTIRTANVERIDGEVSSFQCGNNWSTLAQLGSSRFQRVSNTLPEVKGTNLAWDAAGCEPLLPVEFDRLFEGEVEIEILEIGFLLSNADAVGETYRFAKLDPPVPPAAQVTTLPIETTTTAQPSD